jgi:hypothetical protein
MDGSAVAKLARVWVPPHIRIMPNGTRVHVEGYTRTVAPGFRGEVRAGGGTGYGEGAMGPDRTVEYGDLDRTGRPEVSGPITKWTQDDGVVLERGTAYQWEMEGGATAVGNFSGLVGGGRSVHEDRPLMRDVQITFQDQRGTHSDRFYAPRRGVRSLEDVDREIREAAFRAGLSPIEYLRKMRTQGPNAKDLGGYPTDLSEARGMGGKVDRLVELAAREFSTTSRKKMATTGSAMPDGSYPIPDLDALRRAMQSFGRETPDKRAALKSHIMKRAKALGAGPEILERIRKLGSGS